MTFVLQNEFCKKTHLDQNCEIKPTSHTEPKGLLPGINELGI